MNLIVEAEDGFGGALAAYRSTQSFIMAGYPYCDQRP